MASLIPPDLTPDMDVDLPSLSPGSARNPIDARGGILLANPRRPATAIDPATGKRRRFAGAAYNPNDPRTTDDPEFKGKDQIFFDGSIKGVQCAGHLRFGLWKGGGKTLLVLQKRNTDRTWSIVTANGIPLVEGLTPVPIDDGNENDGIFYTQDITVDGQFTPLPPSANGIFPGGTQSVNDENPGVIGPGGSIGGSGGSTIDQVRTAVNSGTGSLSIVVAEPLDATTGRISLQLRRGVFNTSTGVLVQQALGEPLVLDLSALKGSTSGGSGLTLTQVTAEINKALSSTETAYAPFQTALLARLATVLNTDVWNTASTTYQGFRDKLKGFVATTPSVQLINAQVSGLVDSVNKLNADNDLPPYVPPDGGDTGGNDDGTGDTITPVDLSFRVLPQMLTKFTPPAQHIRTDLTPSTDLSTSKFLVAPATTLTSYVKPGMYTYLNTDLVQIFKPQDLADTSTYRVVVAGQFLKLVKVDANGVSRLHHTCMYNDGSSTLPSDPSNGQFWDNSTHLHLLLTVNNTPTIAEAPFRTRAVFADARDSNKLVNLFDWDYLLDSPDYLTSPEKYDTPDPSVRLRVTGARITNEQLGREEYVSCVDLVGRDPTQPISSTNKAILVGNEPWSDVQLMYDFDKQAFKAEAVEFFAKSDFDGAPALIKVSQWIPPNSTNPSYDLKETPYIYINYKPGKQIITTEFGNLELTVTPITFGDTGTTIAFHKVTITGLANYYYKCPHTRNGQTSSNIRKQYRFHVKAIFSKALPTAAFDQMKLFGLRYYAKAPTTVAPSTIGGVPITDVQEATELGIPVTQSEGGQLVDESGQPLSLKKPFDGTVDWNALPVFVRDAPLGEEGQTAEGFVPPLFQPVYLPGSIRNKPTTLSAFSNDQGFVTEAEARTIAISQQKPLVAKLPMVADDYKGQAVTFAGNYATAQYSYTTAEWTPTLITDPVNVGVSAYDYLTGEYMPPQENWHTLFSKVTQQQQVLNPVQFSPSFTKDLGDGIFGMDKDIDPVDTYDGTLELIVNVPLPQSRQFIAGVDFIVPPDLVGAPFEVSVNFGSYKSPYIQLQYERLNVLSFGGGAGDELQPWIARLDLRDDELAKSTPYSAAQVGVYIKTLKGGSTPRIVNMRPYLRYDGALDYQTQVINRPRLLSQFQNDTGFITTSEQVKADWMETDPGVPSFIENKPDLSAYATTTDVAAQLAALNDSLRQWATATFKQA